jgi:hypothetical protein
MTDHLLKWEKRRRHLIADVGVGMLFAMQLSDMRRRWSHAQDFEYEWIAINWLRLYTLPHLRHE